MKRAIGHWWCTLKRNTFICSIDSSKNLVIKDSTWAILKAHLQPNENWFHKRNRKKEIDIILNDFVHPGWCANECIIGTAGKNKSEHECNAIWLKWKFCTISQSKWRNRIEVARNGMVFFITMFVMYAISISGMTNPWVLQIHTHAQLLNPQNECR